MNNVKKYRKKRNVSIENISLYTGVSKRHLQFIERGQRNPSLSLAKKMADCLNCTIEELFFDEV